MKELLDYLEGLDKSAYISDVQTYEIIFMNRYLRNSLGYAENDEYKGRKCHKILYNSDSPCSFCNNKILENGKFTEWIYENPIIKQRCAVENTLITSNGKNYRVEVSSEDALSQIEKTTHYFAINEAVLNKCLQLFFSSSDPNKSLEALLKYIGESFDADRTYIFEINEDKTASRTYEWCAEKIKPQKELLRSLPISDIDYIISLFAYSKVAQIENLEAIKEQYPVTYSLLKPQKINSLIAAAIYKDGVLSGFLGIDNPKNKSFSLLSRTARELCRYIPLQLERCRLYNKLKKISYKDSLTGAYNSNAMFEHGINAEGCFSFGALYCDINNLKRLNDAQGHSAGNLLIKKCFGIMKRFLKTKWIYRMGNDEFVALFYDVDSEEMKRQAESLRISFLQNNCQISMGYDWSDKKPIDTEQVLNRADSLMYAEKERYYAALAGLMKNEFAQNDRCLQFSLDKSSTDYCFRLHQFLANTYFDISFLLTVLGNDNSTNYFFFGDMQKNLFFISENMRKKFGFENNIVFDLINRWADRISNPVLLEKFWNDIKATLDKKQKQHDLRYQIADCRGNYIWVRCFGKIKWSEDGKKPLFFAGRMSQQDEGFVVDALTNFPAETVLEKQLENILSSDSSCHAIGFSFHSISQINNNHGRKYGDKLIRKIATELHERFSDSLTFYRLSGMRCLALANTADTEEVKKLVLQIKSIIDQAYAEQGISLQHTCSFAVMHYPQSDVSPQDFIENMISLIRISNQSPSRLYIDNSAKSIEEIQKTASIEIHLIEDILNGMKNFRVVIQPVSCVKTGVPLGGETLLRWSFQGKDVSPSTFIPIMENEHMMCLAGRWVFEQTVRSCVRILSYAPNFYLTVNVSLQQLNDDGLIDFIGKTLAKYDLSGEHIVIELTESCMDNQPEKLEKFVKACTDMNIKFALDDFGSGYSSLRVLLKYPSSIIKLDRSLLLEMGDSFEKKGFITSIVYACHQFGKKVCMEGVETKLQYNLAKESGCDLVQGFYCFKPMELDCVYQLVSQEMKKQNKA